MTGTDIHPESQIYSIFGVLAECKRPISKEFRFHEFSKNNYEKERY
jgi:hypothetical protein